MTDPASKIRQTAVDGAGRLVAVVEDPSGLNYSTTYSYDALDDLTGVAQSGQTRTFAYDSLKRLSSALNPESGTITYSYDGDGNLTSKKDARAITTSYSYDSLNHLISKSYSDGITPSVSYNYCNASGCGISYGVGQLMSVTTAALGSASATSTTYTGYSSQGDISGSTQTTGGQSYPLTYGWSLGGDLMQENYPSTRAVTFAYGNGDEPLGAWGSYTSNGTTVNPTYVGWMNFTAGLEIARSFGAPGYYIWQRNHDNRGQLTALVLNNWDSPNNSDDYTGLQEYYNYGTNNNNGNLLSKWENNSTALAAVPGTSLSATVSQSYTYDGVNRLSSVSDSSYSRTYCYDSHGNGWVTAYTGTPAAPGNAPQEIGDACPSVTPYTASNQLTGNSYDSAGNQTSFGGNTVTYDAENREISVKQSSGAVVDSNLYDGNGQRVQKTDAAGTTTYVYDALGRVLAEYVNGALSKEYVRMHSSYIPANLELVAIENPTGSGAPCSTCFLLTDDLGSVRLVGDVNGNYISRHDYLPFGEETSSSDPNRPTSVGFTRSDSAVERFTGKERDAESGLDYFGARYYGSAIGRFTSPDDPLVDQYAQDPQSWNLYSYVRNSPLNHVDSAGQDCITTTVNSAGVTVTTTSGGPADTFEGCSGQYVEGLVNVGSYQYNGSSLTWSDNSAYGGGAINFVPGYIRDWDPGSSNMLGAAQIGSNAPFVNGLTALIELFVSYSPGEGIGPESSLGRIDLPLLSRPKGVPENWVKVPDSKGKGGYKYADPNNPNYNYVRVRTDGTIIQVKNGQSLDVNGNPVRQRTPEAHFPPDQFTFRP